MPLVLKELVNSRTLNESRREGVLEKTLEVLYSIEGSDNPTDPEVIALGPQSGDPYDDGALGLYVIARKFEVMKVAAGGAQGVVKLTVSYGPPERLPNNNADDPEYELSMMSETVHIEEAKDQSHYPSDINTVGNAIGVNGDKVDGVDIYVPKVTYTETRERSSLDKTYRAIVTSMAGTVNVAAWKGWNAREVLFLGATARRKGYGIWKLQYSFAIQPSSVQSITTATGVVNPNKVGWDYLWLERVRSASEDGTTVRHQVEAVHVARVYPTSDFSALGLGTT
jgi:hypothetical protein